MLSAGGRLLVRRIADIQLASHAVASPNIGTSTTYPVISHPAEAVPNSSIGTSTIKSVDSQLANLPGDTIATITVSHTSPAAKPAETALDHQKVMEQSSQLCLIWLGKTYAAC